MLEAKKSISKNKKLDISNLKKSFDRNNRSLVQFPARLSSTDIEYFIR